MIGPDEYNTGLIFRQGLRNLPGDKTIALRQQAILDKLISSALVFSVPAPERGIPWS